MPMNVRGLCIPRLGPSCGLGDWGLHIPVATEASTDDDVSCTNGLVLIEGNCSDSASSQSVALDLRRAEKTEGNEQNLRIRRLSGSLACMIARQKWISRAQLSKFWEIVCLTRVVLVVYWNFCYREQSITCKAQDGSKMDAPQELEDPRGLGVSIAFLLLRRRSSGKRGPGTIIYI